jgi:hypothetical protein
MASFVIMGLVGLAAASFSLYAQVRLSLLAGIPPYLSFVQPLATDGLMAMATLVVLTNEARGIRYYAGGLVVLGAMASVSSAALENVLPHDQVAPLALRLVLGGWPSACLALVIHLAAVMVRHAAGKGRVAPATSTAVAPAPVEVYAAPGSRVGDAAVTSATAAPEPGAASHTPAPAKPAPKPTPKPAAKPAAEKPAKPAAEPVLEDTQEMPAPLRLATPGRPEWLHADMTAKDAMHRYLDENPDAEGPELDRLGKYLTKKPSKGYGRKMRRQWLDQQEEQLQRASGE